MKMRLALVAVILLAVACGSSGMPKAAPQTTTTGAAGPATTARDALKAQMKYLSDGQYDRLWDALHPAQQAFVPKALFVSCYQQRFGGVDVTSVAITDSYDTTADVPGTDLKAVKSTAVTAKITLTHAGQSTSSTDTYHEFLVNGDWRWTASDADGYKQGACPGA